MFWFIILLKEESLTNWMRGTGYCMVLQRGVVAILFRGPSHYKWIQQNSPRSSHFLLHIWQLTPHTLEPTFCLLDDVQRFCVMNWRFQILIHHSINLLPVFSSSVAVSHDTATELASFSYSHILACLYCCITSCIYICMYVFFFYIC